MDGPGFGIKIDQHGSVWVGNYHGNSVSKFSPRGVPLSPEAGFTGGGLNNPQGPAVDQSGNIWFPNAGNSTVTEFPNGNPKALVSITGGGLDAPFSVAVDGTGNVWVSNGGSSDPTLSSVLTELPAADPTHPIAFSGGGTRESKGIAVDSLGNVWVSNLVGRNVSGELLSRRLSLRPAPQGVEDGILAEAQGRVLSPGIDDHRLSSGQAFVSLTRARMAPGQGE